MREAFTQECSSSLSSSTFIFLEVMLSSLLRFIECSIRWMNLRDQFWFGSSFVQILCIPKKMSQADLMVLNIHLEVALMSVSLKCRIGKSLWKLGIYGLRPRDSDWNTYV